MSGKYTDEVYLTESDFAELLELVEACDQQQLLRLYCKIGAVISGDFETIRGGSSIRPPNSTAEIERSAEKH